MSDTESDVDVDVDVDVVWGWPTLPTELCDLIMLAAHETSEIYAAVLANTCRQECDRYRRIVPEEERITLHELKIELAFQEGTVVWDRKNRRDLPPGEPGYAYWKNREKELETRWIRQEWVRPEARRAKAIKAKEMRRTKAQWKKGRDADGDGWE
jgi:hypothetical protein